MADIAKIITLFYEIPLNIYTVVILKQSYSHIFYRETLL